MAKSSTPAGPARGAKGAFSEQQLAALMPERAGAWRRVGLGNPVPGSETDYQPAMRAEYARGDDRAEVELADLGKAGAIAARTVKADPTPRKTDAGQQRVYASKGRLIREELGGNAGPGHASIVFANGFSLRVSGMALDGAALQELIEAIDLAGIEALGRGAR